MKIHQTFRAHPNIIKQAKALARLDNKRTLSRWYEIAVEEKIQRDVLKTKALAKMMNG